MADVLSQSQIDALLKSMQGSGPEEEVQAVEQKTEAEETKYSKYDFYSPRKFTKDKMKILNSVFENYARILTSQVNGIFRVLTDITVLEVQERRYYEFVNSLHENDSITMANAEIQDKIKNSVPLMLHVTPGLVITLINHMLGGGDEIVRVPPDIDGLMAEGGYIAQAEEGPRNDVGEGGHKLHRAHPRQFSAGGEIGEQDTQKGSSGGRHSGIDQAVAKGAPLRAGQISPVFQRKCECAAGGVGEGGEQNHAVFQRHDSEKEHRGAPSQEGNGTGGGVGRGNSGVPSVHADALFLLHGAAVAVESRRCCGDHHDADSRSPSQIRGGDHLEVGLCGQDTKASANNDGRAEIRQIHGKEHQQNGEQCGTYQGKNHMPQGLPGRGAQIPGGKDQTGVQVVEGGEEHQCGKGDAPDDLEDDHAVPAVWVDAEPQELMSDDPSPVSCTNVGRG